MFYTGSLRQDAVNGVNRGWVVGKFLADPTRYTTEIEVKYWEFEVGNNHGHPAKTSDTTEWTYILTGRVRCEIEGQSLELKAGDYILIHPGTPNNTVAEILESASGICVKAPSDPTAKKILLQRASGYPGALKLPPVMRLPKGCCPSPRPVPGNGILREKLS